MARPKRPDFRVTGVKYCANPDHCEYKRIFKMKDSRKARRWLATCIFEGHCSFQRYEKVVVREEIKRRKKVSA